MAHARGCRNFIIVVVTFAVAGAWWWIGAPPKHGILRFVAKMVGATSGFILFVTFYGIVVNFGRIVDWFVVRVPPSVHDAVLGDLRYDDGRWSTHLGTMRFSFEGRRRGPDEVLVRAGSDAVSNLDEYERRARAFALERLASVDSVGTLRSLSVEKTDKAPAIVLWFDLSDDPEDFLQVTLVAGEPTQVEAPNRSDNPQAPGTA